MSMKKFIYLLYLLALSQQVSAQKDTSKTSPDEVVVTATKSPKKLSETGKVVTVITREQIEQSVGKNLSQLLNEQTGILVNGAVSNEGKDKSLYLRGASDRYTLLLLDGIALNDPSGVGGSIDLRLLPLEQIERIEILKGSQSTLYGSNAVAGVINIITRKSTNEGLKGSGLLSYGSYNSLKGIASINRGGKVLDYNLNYIYNSTDGISEAKDSTGNAGFGKNGYTQQSFQSNVGVHINDQFRLSPYFRYTKFKGSYDNDAFTDGNNHSSSTLLNTGLLGNYSYKRGTIHLNYAYDYTDRIFDGQYGMYEYSGKFQNADAYVHHTFTPWLEMIAGTNFQHYGITNVDSGNSIISPYVSVYFKSKNGYNIELGGRYNNHNKYGNNFTYSFNPSYLINGQIKLFTNISSGFRPPSINELFGPSGANPGLKPEKSNNIEAGIQTWVSQKKISLLATYFNREITDVIIYDFSTGYQNRDKQKDHGLEAELIYIPSTKWKLKASYTFIDGQVTQQLAGKDTSFHNLVRRPKNTVLLSAGYQISSHFFMSSTLHFVDKRKDIFYDPNTYEANSINLNGYALWNVYAEYRLTNNKLRFFMDAKNLTNKTNYYEVYGYNVQGFTLVAGIHFKF